MDIQHGDIDRVHGHEAWTCSIGMQNGRANGHAACIGSMDKQHFLILMFVFIFMLMQSIHAAKLCGEDMQRGHAAWTYDMDMQRESRMDMQDGDMDMEHDMKHEHAALACRLGIQHEHA
jgi:hypothetical protein